MKYKNGRKKLYKLKNKNNKNHSERFPGGTFSLPRERARNTSYSMPIEINHPSNACALLFLCGGGEASAFFFRERERGDRKEEEEEKERFFLFLGWGGGGAACGGAIICPICHRREREREKQKNLIPHLFFFLSFKKKTNSRPYIQ